MALSKMMASRSPTNQDPPPQNSSPAWNLNSRITRGSALVCMDDMHRNMYTDSDAFVLGSNVAVPGGVGLRNGNVGKAVDEEYWDNLCGLGSGGGKPLLTMNDLLATAGLMNQEDVRIPAAITMAPPTPGTVAFGMDTQLMNPTAGVPPLPFSPGAAARVQNGYGADYSTGVSVPPSSGRGKRRAVVEETTMDKATQQKQRRMIKNRESAARSRERKQAHTVELESVVAQLEEDNARLLKEQAEIDRKRYKQLMETVIPIVEKPRRNAVTSNDGMKNRGKIKCESRHMETVIPIFEQRRTSKVWRRTNSMTW